MQNNDILDILIFLGSQRPSHCTEIRGLQVPWRRKKHHVLVWPCAIFTFFFVDITNAYFGLIFFGAFSSVITEKMIIYSLT